MAIDIKKHTNYASDGLLIEVNGELYPLLKSTEKMVFYMKEDEIKRISMSKVGYIMCEGYDAPRI
jgi:hypothetical protein